MKFIGILLALIIFSPSSLGAGSVFALPLSASDINKCAVHTYHHERLRRIPAHLLGAISKIESGRYHAGTKEVIAWPWTINVNGESKYFASKGEAVKHVRSLLAQGIQSIDVGCMQVNLKHHPDAFPNVESAFDPRTNVAYAAEFLTRLKNNLGTWTKAVAHYHSANSQYHIPYRKKVYKAWLRERQRNNILASTGTGIPMTDDQLSQPAFHGKRYRTGSLEEVRATHHNNPHWRILEARIHLARYRERAAQNMRELEQTRKKNQLNRKTIKDDTKPASANSTKVRKAPWPVILKGNTNPYPNPIQDQNTKADKIPSIQSQTRQDPRNSE